MPSFQKSAVFFNIFQKAFGPPPPLLFEHLSYFAGGVFSLLLPFSMLKNAFKKYPPQNRTNVQIKGGGGSKAFWTMFKKTALFWNEGFPKCLILHCHCMKLHRECMNYSGGTKKFALFSENGSIGWQKLVAFRCRQRWPLKFSSSAYLLNSRQICCFCT